MSEKKNSVLRVASVRLRRFLGLEEANLEPGRVTIVRGPNETGKTSLIQGVRAGLGGGVSLSNYQRIDTATGQPVEGEPEVMMEIKAEQGPENYLVDRVGDELGLRKRVGDSAAFEDVGKPQSVLSALFDGRACNPIDFDEASDKDRARMLLEALPLTLDEGALDRILGEHRRHLGPIPTHLHPLEYVGTVRAMIFEARTGVNRDQKAMAGSADQLRRNIPAELPANPAAAIEALAQEIETEAAALARAEEKATADHHAAVQAAANARDLEDEKVTAGFRGAKDKLNADLNAEIGKAAGELEQAIAKLRADHEKWKRDRENAVEAALDGLRDADGKKLDENGDVYEKAAAAASDERLKVAGEHTKAAAAIGVKRERLAAMRASAEAFTKAAALTDQANDFQRQADSLDAEGAALTKVLGEIDAFARAMAENIPIPGLSIADKVVKVDGVPYKQLNTAKRYEIAVKVAMMRAGRLPVIFVDRAESLDPKHFEALVEQIIKSGAQAFITRVDGSDETVVEKRG
jgi:hypothetical protein